MTNPAITSERRGKPEYQQVLQAAENVFRQDPDWVTFFREVLGIDGVVRRAFANFDDLTDFERSSEYDLIQKMIVRLREKKPTEAESEPTRVITVRLPKSMHEYLRTEAHDLRTSMNKLCISKLLQVIEQDKIPREITGQDENERLRRRISRLESKLRAYECQETSVDFEAIDTGPARGYLPR